MHGTTGILFTFSHKETPPASARDARYSACERRLSRSSKRDRCTRPAAHRLTAACCFRCVWGRRSCKITSPRVSTSSQALSTCCSSPRLPGTSASSDWHPRESTNGRQSQLSVLGGPMNLLEVNADVSCADVAAVLPFLPRLEALIPDGIWSK